MFTLTKRQSDIVKKLIDKNDYITIKELSEIFNVSTRTIRYDLNQIKVFLNNHNHKIESIPNKGTKIISDSKEIGLLLFKHRDYSQEEKVDLIIIELLTKDNNTYESIAESIDISRATVINNISQVENKIKKYNLTLNKEKGIGIKIEGNECNILDCFNSLIDKNYRNYIFSKNISVFFNEENLTYVNTIVENVEKSLSISFYDLERLNIMLSYIIYRKSLNKIISKLPKHIETIKNNKNYDAYVKVLRNIDIDDNHKTYIISILMNSKFRSLKKVNKNSGISNEIAKFLLKELEKIQPLDKQERNKFLLGLSTHLEVALYRIKNNIPIENVLRDQIRICLPLTYEFTKKQLLKCEEIYNISFSEDEISYIAMYMGSVYESSVKIDNNIKIMLVCSFGMTTSSILESRMKQMIPEYNFIGPFSKHEALKYLKNNQVDLIISTNDDEYYNIPTIRVNPLLYKEDIEYIRAQLFEHNYNMMNKNFIDTYSSTYEKDKKINYLKDFIPKHHIQILDDIDDWRESIKVAAKPLLDEGLIKQRYIDKMIKAVEQLGTYMVILPETAFVHAGIEDGINKACCALLVLKKAVMFGDSKSKKVSNVVVIGFEEKEKTTLLDLVNILSANENMKILKNENLNISMIENLNDVGVMDELVSIEKMKTKVDACDWQAAIKQAGQLLVDSNDIDKEYIQMMIDSVNELGPYIVLTKGFALAHSAPCKEVKNTSISLINLKKGVNFGSNNDPVNVIMCLACADKKSHLDLLQKVATKLMQEGMIEKLSNCKTEKEMYSIINN